MFLLPSFAFASFDTNLKYGSSGSKVVELQEFLQDQGIYTGPITGNFYSLTRTAVKQFQIANNISPASGFFGSLSRAKANIIIALNTEEDNTAQIADTGVITPPVVEPYIPPVSVYTPPTQVYVPPTSNQSDTQSPVITNLKQSGRQVGTGESTLAYYGNTSCNNCLIITTNEPTSLKIKYIDSSNITINSNSDDTTSALEELSQTAQIKNYSDLSTIHIVKYSDFGLNVTPANQWIYDQPNYTLFYAFEVSDEAGNVTKYTTWQSANKQATDWPEHNFMLMAIE